jgi:hypothetical protein
MRLATPRRALVALTAVTVAAAALGGAALSSDGAIDACGIPSSAPVWIEYGEGALPADVRAVFQRPGVTVATSGTTLPQTYRAKGAHTVFFVLQLPRYVGSPTAPADPATIDGAAQTVYDRAVHATECEQPRIGINELLGPAAAVPWEPNVAQYRANVLGLLQGLSDRGARPALFVHGNPGFAGEAAAWWREVGAVADVAYESYYRAPNISRLGRIVGPRRVRLGMRSILRKFASVGIPRERLGLVLGFQVATGKFGREGLQPREEWLRFVKWNALAARQVTLDERTSTVWSWGWANFGPQSVDPDKAAAACVYLWARDQRLCDGPAVAGPAFKRSLVEGPIVIPDGVECISAAGKLRTAPILALAKVTRDRQQALDGLFSRQALRKLLPVSTADLLLAEQEVVDRAFGGDRAAYLFALQQRSATRQMALGILEDELRRARGAEQLAATQPGVTPHAWSTAAGAADIATATCRRDLLPGRGNFPASDVRVIGVVPLAAKLPFLTGDVEPPAPATELVATVKDGAVTLDWPDGPEADLAGYDVYRGIAPEGPFTRITPVPLATSTYADRTLAPGTAAYYVVHSLDTTGNLSAASPVATPSAPPPSLQR